MGEMGERSGFSRWYWVLVLVVGLGFSLGVHAESTPVEMIVSLKDAKALTIRAAPSAEAAAVAFVENGKTVLKKGQEDANGFVMIQLSDGRVGWTKIGFLARVPAPQPAVAPVVPDVVNSAAEARAAVSTPALTPVPPAQTEAKAEAPRAPDTAQVAPRRVAPVALETRGERASVAPAANGSGFSIGQIVIAGIIGLLIGLVVGGRAGIAHASRSIHDRYEVIG